MINNSRICGNSMEQKIIKQEWFVILLHKNLIVAFVIINTKIYNNNLYNT